MSNCSDARRQRGEILLEALVGVLITGLIGAGLAHVASNVMNSQRDTKVEHIAVVGLRSRLQNQGIGLCAAGSTTVVMPGNASTPVTVTCTSTSANISLNGVAHTVTAPPLVKLSVAATAMGIKGADTSSAALQVSSAMAPTTAASTAVAP